MTNPTLTRRALIQRGALATAGAAALAGTAVLEEGCNASQWIQTALADLPTILQIVTSILGIVGVQAGAQVQEYGAAAQAALTTAQSVISSYQTAEASAKPGLLGEIDAALVAAQNNLSGILSVFHVSDDIMQKTIQAAVGSAITIVLAIQALIPPPPVAPVQGRRRALHASAQKDGREVMKEAFNVIVGKAYPAAVIH